MAESRIDESLSQRDGVLWIEQVASTDLVQRFGSPLFVFSENQLRRNVRRFRDSFSHGWSHGDVKIMPAAKANWQLAIQRILVDEGCGADIYSPGELDVALRAGVEPQWISANGVPKDRDHVARIIDVGARLTIDSLRDVDIVEQLATSLDKPVRVRLRVRPPLAGYVRHSQFAAEGLVPTDVAALVYKGGLSRSEVIEAGQRLLKLPNVEIVGFHQHHGRHRPDLEFWAEQMRTYAEEIAIVSQALGGLRPQEISIGGGFPIPRDPHNAATHYSDPLMFGILHTLSRGLKLMGQAIRYRTIDSILSKITTRPNRTPAPTIEQFAATVTSTLGQSLTVQGIDPAGIVLQLEPGRSIHGNAGVHLATIEATKFMTSPIHWNVITIDSSQFFLVGGAYEHHLHDYRIANRMDAPMAIKGDVVGRSCYGDRILGNVPLPELQIGDIFALLDTGAYQEVSTSNFNALPRPASVLVTDDRAELIRRRETLDDVFARDQLPEHLEKGVRY